MLTPIASAISLRVRCCDISRLFFLFSFPPLSLFFFPFLFFLLLSRQFASWLAGRLADHYVLCTIKLVYGLISYRSVPRVSELRRGEGISGIHMYIHTTYIHTYAHGAKGRCVLFPSDGGEREFQGRQGRRRGTTRDDGRILSIVCVCLQSRSARGGGSVYG